MRPSNNLENKALLDILKSSASVYEIQIDSSETPLENNKYQMPLKNQGSFWPF